VQVAGVTFGPAVDAYLEDPAALVTRKGEPLKPSYEKDRRERLRSAVRARLVGNK
jgi:hypothetical protein